MAPRSIEPHEKHRHVKRQTAQYHIRYYKIAPILRIAAQLLSAFLQPWESIFVAITHESPFDQRRRGNPAHHGDEKNLQSDEQTRRADFHGEGHTSILLGFFPAMRNPK